MFFFEALVQIFMRKAIGFNFQLNLHETVKCWKLQEERRGKRGFLMFDRHGTLKVRLKCFCLQCFCLKFKFL